MAFYSYSKMSPSSEIVMQKSSYKLEIVFISVKFMQDWSNKTLWISFYKLTKIISITIMEQKSIF